MLANKIQHHLNEHLQSFNAQGTLTQEKLAAIRSIFTQQGAVHITNTSLANKSDILPFLSALGFADHEQFSAGGRTSATWQKKWAAPGLRNLDHYPAHFYLLPNNEIQYQRYFPTRVLFFCTIPAAKGGRTFLHSAGKLESLLSADHHIGRPLLEKISQHGLMIETGFLDAEHPEKKNNYFQSWQERFGTADKDQALATAQSLTDEYDECWWREDSGYSVLMTRITLDGHITHQTDGKCYLRFPRIAMDAPQIKNGFRRFPLGNGQELTENEKTLLKEIYYQTQEGFPWKSGDILLMDNIRYGHSREPFETPREVLIGMAGLQRISRRKNHDTQN